MAEMARSAIRGPLFNDVRDEEGKCRLNSVRVVVLLGNYGIGA